MGQVSGVLRPAVCSSQTTLGCTKQKAPERFQPWTDLCNSVDISVMLFFANSHRAHSSKIYCAHAPLRHKSPGSAFGKNSVKNMEHLFPTIRRIHRKQLMFSKEEEK